MYTQLLKHTNNTDVAIEILRQFYVPEKQVYKLKVCWWNIGNSHKPFSMGIVEKIVINKQDMPNWQVYRRSA